MQLTPMEIILDPTNLWPDLPEAMPFGAVTGVALLPNATSGGAHGVIFRITLPDGSFALASTTLSLFVGAARGCKARAEMQGQSFDGHPPL